MAGSSEAGASARPRDRRDDGRPEQARPRDRTGRPLPYDQRPSSDHASGDGSSIQRDGSVAGAAPLLAEPLVHDGVDDALARGLERWGQQRFFEAHELLEVVWKSAPPAERDVWKGIIQVAVTCVHLQRGNPLGAARLVDRALERLGRHGASHRGIDLVRLRAIAVGLQAELRAGRSPSTDIGPLPVLSPGLIPGLIPGLPPGAGASGAPRPPGATA